MELAAAAQEATGKLSNLAGVELDRERAKRAGVDIAESAGKFKALLDYLETSSDFQLVEMYHVIQLTAERNGVPSLRTLEKVVNWQAACLLAMGDGFPQPPQPQGIDLDALTQGKKGDDDGAARKSVEVEGGLWRMPPFSASDFSGRPEAEALQDDFENLVKQHKDLVSLGESFASFDAGGKEMYITQMRDISTRWADLMKAAQEVGVPPSSGYGSYSHEYLKRARLSRAGFRALMLEVHETMQKQVQTEAATR